MIQTRQARALLSGILFLSLGCRRSEAPPATADSVPATAAAPDSTALDSLTIYEAYNLPGRAYWAVEILNGGIRYHWAENRAGVTFGAGRVEGGDSLSVWTAKRTGAGPQSLSIQLLRTPCLDSPPSAYRAALVVDGTAYEGCAKRGTQAQHIPGGQ